MVNPRETIDPCLKESRVLRAVPANTREALNDLKGSKVTQHAKHCCFFAVFFFFFFSQIRINSVGFVLHFCRTVAIFLAGPRDLTEYNSKPIDSQLPFFSFIVINTPAFLSTPLNSRTRQEVNPPVLSRILLTSREYHVEQCK